MIQSGLYSSLRQCSYKIQILVCFWKERARKASRLGPTKVILWPWALLGCFKSWCMKLQTCTELTENLQTWTWSSMCVPSSWRKWAGVWLLAEKYTGLTNGRDVKVKDGNSGVSCSLKVYWGKGFTSFFLWTTHKPHVMDQLHVHYMLHYM